MSSIKLSPNASGTGIFTIAAPNSNTDRTLTLPDASGTFLTNSGTEAGAFSTLSVNSNNISAVNSLGFRNRIINGDMRIDQRNAGASVTQTTSNVYVTDRFFIYGTPASKVTAQQNAGSVSPPAGFTNYLGITSSSAYTVTSNDTFLVAQTIEGFNVSDLAWGTASAQPATLSFWVRSSLTGTFGGSIATTKTAVWVMPFSYTISSANTWTYITVSIPAATSTGGTNNDNTAGVFVRFGLGSAGTSAGGTAGTWTNAGNYIQPSGNVSVVGTNGATFYITGVQLEAGSVATPFERRDYGRELIMCQRYFTTSFQVGAAPSSPNNLSVTQTGLYTINEAGSQQFPVVMRTAPTVTCFAPLANPAINNVRVGGTGSIVAGTVAFIGERSYNQYGPSASTGYQFGYTANAEL